MRGNADKPQLCTVGGKQTGGSAGSSGRCVTPGPGVAFFPQTSDSGAEASVGLSVLCPLSTVGGEGECEVVAAPRRGVAGRAAGGERALQGQPVRGELVGVDQPPVPEGAQRGLTDLPCGPDTEDRGLEVKG